MVSSCMWMPDAPTVSAEMAGAHERPCLLIYGSRARTTVQPARLAGVAVCSDMAASFTAYIIVVLHTARFASPDLQDHAGERHAQYFDGAFGDHHAALIAKESLDWQFLRQSHAAVNLHDAIRGPERAFVAENLHHESFLAAVLAAIEFP